MAIAAASRAPCALLAASYATFILTLLWTLLALGGLATTGSRLFNWHPILASGAVLAVLTPGVLVQPAPRGSGATRDWRVRAVHAFCLLVAFVVLSVAVAVAYSSHLQQNKPNLYSLHSWLGLGTLFLMKGNIVAGLTSTLCAQWKAAALVGKSHRLGGMLVCLMAFVSATVGFAELQTKLARNAGSVWQLRVVAAAILGFATMCVGIAVVALLGSREHDRRVEELLGAERVRNKIGDHAYALDTGKTESA
ncbi:unnamed protein product [Agarophyton chilense]